MALNISFDSQEPKSGEKDSNAVNISLVSKIVLLKPECNNSDYVLNITAAFTFRYNADQGS